MLQILSRNKEGEKKPQQDIVTVHILLVSSLPAAVLRELKISLQLT